MYARVIKDYKSINNFNHYIKGDIVKVIDKVGNNYIVKIKGCSFIVDYIPNKNIEVFKNG